MAEPLDLIDVDGVVAINAARRCGPDAFDRIDALSRASSAILSAALHPLAAAYPTPHQHAARRANVVASLVVRALEVYASPANPHAMVSASGALSVRQMVERTFGTTSGQYRRSKQLRSLIAAASLTA